MTGDLHPDASAAAELARPTTGGRPAAAGTSATGAADPVQRQLEDLSQAHSAMQKVVEAQARQILALQARVRTHDEDRGSHAAVLIHAHRDAETFYREQLVGSWAETPPKYRPGPRQRR